MEGSTNNKENLLTSSQFAFILFGTIVGVGVLSLPNGVVKFAHQDGWIAALIGAIYPLYIVILTKFISKKHPNQSVITLSKNYFGNFLGTILNFIFATSLIYYTTSIVNYYSNFMRNFAIGFLNPLRIIGITLIFVMYAVTKGLKVIGRISEISFFITLILIFSPLQALKAAQVVNVCPILGSSLKDIGLASIQSMFAYSGAEIILIIYPFLKDKTKIFSSSIKIIAVITFIYGWCVFITIYYLGPDIVTKSYWSFLLVTESVTITVINNYRYIFVFFWSLMAFKSATIYCYGAMYILKDCCFKKIEVKKLYLFLYLLLVILTLQYGNEVKSEEINNFFTRVYVVFNILYTTVIALFVFLKRGDRC